MIKYNDSCVGDSVQYQWRENDDKVVIPDVSINCNMRDRKNISFTGVLTQSKAGKIMLDNESVLKQAELIQ